MNPMISGAGSQGIMGVKTWLCSTNGDIPPDLLVPRKQEYVKQKNTFWSFKINSSCV